MRRRTLGRTGLAVSELGYGAWGIGGTMWVGADDDESLRALRRAIELGVNFIDTAYGYGDGHSEELVGVAARAGGRDRVRGEQDAAAEPAVARATRRARAGCIPGGVDPLVHGAQPREPRRRGDRRPAVPCVVGRVGRPGRLARSGDRAPTGREDPLLRRLGQRPSTRERRPARRVRARRHDPADLQHLRPEPRGRDPRCRRGCERGRHRQGPLRRGLAHRPHSAGDDLPRGRLPEQVLRGRSEA